MRNITMLTIVPYKYAKDFKEKGRISDFSTLPQIHEKTMQVIRDFIEENVGYDNLPLASLRCVKTGSLEGVDFEEYLTANSNESVLFQLEIPEDMIVSVDYDVLLECSNDMFHAIDEMDLDFSADTLRCNLTLGIEGDESDGIISFIPFLDYDKCKFFAKLSKDFKAEGNMLEDGKTQIRLKTLSSFEN